MKSFCLRKISAPEDYRVLPNLGNFPLSTLCPVMKDERKWGWGWHEELDRFGTSREGEACGELEVYTEYLRNNFRAIRLKDPQTTSRDEAPVSNVLLTPGSNLWGKKAERVVGLDDGRRRYAE